MMFELNHTRLLFLATIQQRFLKGVLFLHREIILLAIAAVRIPGGCCPPWGARLKLTDSRSLKRGTANSTVAIGNRALTNSDGQWTFFRMDRLVVLISSSVSYLAFLNKEENCIAQSPLCRRIERPPICLVIERYHLLQLGALSTLHAAFACKQHSFILVLSHISTRFRNEPMTCSVPCFIH